MELRITNYEFPALNGNRHDRNWLLIYLNVKSSFGDWKTTNACLLTWEVKELIKWFEDIANDAPIKYKELDFLEPNLSFEFMGSGKAGLKNFRLKFDLESRPQFADDAKEYFIDFVSDNLGLKQIAGSLSEEYSKFPEK